MRVYVHDEKTNGIIARACKSLGCEVLTLHDVRKRQKDPEYRPEHFFLDGVDVMVMEITRPTSDIHFILAQAILRRKPLLCVYAKNQAPRELLSFIKRDDVQQLKTFSYIEEQLPEAVKIFIKRYDPRFIKEVKSPEIKFTLRLSKYMNEVLEEASIHMQRTKADIIRELLEDFAEQRADMDGRKRRRGRESVV